MSRRPPTETAAAAPGPNDPLTTAEAGRVLGVTSGRVHQLIKAGKLRASRLSPRGRYLILRSWVTEAIQANEVRRSEKAAAVAAARDHEFDEPHGAQS